MTRSGLLLLACLVNPVLTLRAQAPAVTPGPTLAATYTSLAGAPVDAGRALHELNADLRAATRPTYWLSGGIIGGATLGVLTGALAAGMCANSDSGNSTGTCVLGAGLGAVVGGMLGFTVGALVGGQFPKPEPATPGAPPGPG